MASDRKCLPFQRDSAIAVIGAGPAGVHMIHELSKRGFENLTLFERTNRIGGQSHTIEVEGTAFDLGTLNYLNRYPVLEQLQRELDLKLINVDAAPKALSGQREVSASRYIFDQYDAHHPTWGPAWLRYLRFLLKLKRDLKRASRLRESLVDQHGFPRRDRLDELAKTTAQFLRDHKLDSLIYFKEFTYRAWGSLGPDAFTAFQDLMGIKGPASGPNRPIVKGGHQEVWEKLLERSSATVQLGAEVVSLEGTDDGVRLIWQGAADNRQESEFDFAISSAPFPMKYLANPTPNQKELFSEFNTHNQNPAIVSLYSAEKSEQETIWLVSFHDSGHPFTTVCVGNEHILQSPDSYARSGRVIKTALQCSFREKHFGDVSDEDFNLAKRTLKEELETTYQQRNVEIIHQHVWGEYFISMSQEQIQNECPWRLVDLQSENNMWFIGVGACGPVVPNILAYNNMLLDLQGFNDL